MVTEDLYLDYQSRLLAADRAGCSAIVKELLESGIRMKALYTQVFQRSLYDVGHLWETNKISVAVEHLCTAITESMIHLAYPYMFAAEHTGKKAIVACTPGEYHQVGPRMVADYFELNGWDAYFLGSNTPESEVVRFIEEKSPDVLAVSMSVFFHLNSMLRLVSVVRKEYPDLTILAGGQGFNWGGTDAFNAFDNVHIVRSLDDLEEKFLRLNTHAG